MPLWAEHGEIASSARDNINLIYVDNAPTGVSVLGVTKEIQCWFHFLRFWVKARYHIKCSVMHRSDLGTLQAPTV